MVSAAELWAASGCLSLTGRPTGLPNQAGRGAALLATQLAGEINESSAALGRRVELDGSALLAERSAHTLYRRQGNVSCNGTSHFIECANGHVSLSLSRPSDLDSLSACFEYPYDPRTNPWEFVADRCKQLGVELVVERAALLGLSCGAIGSTTCPSSNHPGSPPITSLSDAIAVKNSPLIVDLSALWAGPLAANICGLAGARVIKVESTDRLDGSRAASPSFYDLLHGGHDSVVVDFNDTHHRGWLRDLIKGSDAVITSARPRALDQLDINPVELMKENPITCWIAISAFGPGEANRVGFGDDAAVAGGLFGWDRHGPIYVADAIADPLTGLFAASLLLRALSTGNRFLTNVALVEVAALAASMASGEELINPVVRPPRSRPVTTPAAAPGAHNEKWLR
jgi:hypothetical protein